MCRRRLDPGGFCVFFCAGTQRHKRCINRSDPGGFCNVFQIKNLPAAIFWPTMGGNMKAAPDLRYL